nr:hypothetical protein [Sorangium cellulosum]
MKTLRFTNDVALLHQLLQLGPLPPSLTSGSGWGTPPTDVKPAPVSTL